MGADLKAGHSVRLRQRAMASASASASPGRWFVSLTVDTQDPLKRPADNQGVVGVDLGVPTLAQLSQQDLLQLRTSARGPAAGTAALSRRRSRRRCSPGQQDVEDLVDATRADPAAADAPLPAVVLRRVIAAASDPADLERRLAALYHVNDRCPFTTRVERALFAADVLGYCNAQTGRDC